MQDLRVQRIERQLASVISVTLAAAREAEALRDQTMAEDIHEVLAKLRKITEGIGSRGQTYKRL